MRLILPLLSSHRLLKVETIHEVYVVSVAWAAVHCFRQQSRFTEWDAHVEGLVLEFSLVKVLSVAACRVQNLFFVEGGRRLVVAAVRAARDR